MNAFNIDTFLVSIVMAWKELSSIQLGYYGTGLSSLAIFLNSIKVTLAFKTFA